MCMGVPGKTRRRQTAKTHTKIKQILKKMAGFKWLRTGARSRSSEE